MKIAIPTFGADHGKSGIGEYLRRLIQEWSTQAPHHDFELIGPAEDKSVFLPQAVNWAYHEVSPRWCKTLPNLWWHQRRLPALARQRDYDLLFLPAGNRRLPWSAPCPTVGTLHDFSHLHVEQKYSRSRHFYIEHVLPRLAQRLDHVLTVSESSAKDIRSHAQVQTDRIEVIFNGADVDVYRNGDADRARQSVAEALGVDAPFLLYVSRIECPGKNHIALIEAFEQFCEQTGRKWHLILPGQDWNGAEQVHQRIAVSAHAERIHTPGFVSRQLLLDCYSAAEFFVFPSLYEGFGIPLLEAMAAGLPVIAANCSSLPEVGGDAARYFDPHKPHELTSQLTALADKPGEVQQMRESGIARSKQFPWSLCASKTLAALERVYLASQPQSRSAA